MFFPVMVGQLKTFLTEKLFHQGIDNNLLANGVPSDLPGQLTGPSSYKYAV
jgi:hypothetical protein